MTTSRYKNGELHYADDSNRVLVFTALGVEGYSYAIEASVPPGSLVLPVYQPPNAEDAYQDWRQRVKRAIPGAINSIIYRNILYNDPTKVKAGYAYLMDRGGDKLTLLQRLGVLREGGFDVKISYYSAEPLLPQEM